MPHLYCPPIWNQAPSPFRPENYKSRPSCLGLAANTKPGQSTFGLLGYWTGTRSNAVFGNCTTRLRNTHRTEEREVLYPWHPWSGCLVRIHEVVEKAAGDVVRCSHAGDPLGLWQELPVWMLDRAACAPMRVGQKNKLTYRWARKGSRPRAAHDQRTQSTYLFGAVCPERGAGAALVLPA